MAKHIGATIRALRLERGLKQSELADAVGIRQQTLYRQEAGEIQNPKNATLRRIALCLGVPLDTLLGGPVKAGSRKRTPRKGAA